jgi:hypothetical protein
MICQGLGSAVKIKQTYIKIVLIVNMIKIQNYFDCFGSND